MLPKIHAIKSKQEEKSKVQGSNSKYKIKNALKPKELTIIENPH